MYGLSGRPSNPNVAALALALLERLPQFADEATERICQQVEAYRQEQPGPRDDLGWACRADLGVGVRRPAGAGPSGVSGPGPPAPPPAPPGAALAAVVSPRRAPY